MQLNKKQKSVAVIYCLVFAYLISFVPMVKSFPCGCTFKYVGLIWRQPPLLFDSSAEPTESGGSPVVAWAIDWLRIGQRISISTLIALLVLVLARDRKQKRDKVQRITYRVE